MNQTRIYVAVVDDDQSFARALERLFRASGFGVHTYLSAESFLDSTALPQPDCLVLDIQLGAMSGLDLQRRLGELGSQAPIIFVTAHDSPVIRTEAEQGGCAAFFHKPVPPKLLLAAINKAIKPGCGNDQMAPPAAGTARDQKP
jgi:FixJ family two-component response regulator